MMSQEWAEFIESGIAILLACRDRNMVTDGARGVGAVLSLDRRYLTIYVQKDSAERILPILEDTKEVALTMAVPTTYKALQVKGRFLSSRQGDARDRVITDRYRELFTTEVGKAGIPEGTIRRLVTWPAMALEIEIRDLFIQTPGPRAGEKVK